MSRNNQLRDNALIIIIASLGGATSVLVGYAGTLLSTLTASSLIAPQLLAGLHVFWLTLAASMINRRGAATATGALKGLIEAVFFSHLGIFSLLVSLTEGIVVDLVFVLFKKSNKAASYLAGGLSSASNLIIIQLFFLPPLPLLILFLAYSSAFLSGLCFGGYLKTQALKVIPPSFRLL